jgi:hypothetical protein
VKKKIVKKELDLITVGKRKNCFVENIKKKAWLPYRKPKINYVKKQNVKRQQRVILKEK